MAVIEHEHVASTQRDFVGRQGAHVSRPAVLAAAYALDVGLVAAIGLTCAFLTGPEGQAISLWLIGGTVLVAFAVATGLQARWCYTIAALRRPTAQVPAVLRTSLVAFAATVAAVYLFGAPLTWRPWLISWSTVSALGLIGLRFGWSPVVDRWASEGRLVRRTVIVGGGTEAHELITRIENSKDQHIEILGIFDDRSEERSQITDNGFRNLGTFAELESFCRSEKVDLLIVALPHVAEARLTEILKQLWTLPVDVRLSALGSRLRLARDVYDQVGGVPTLPVFRKSLSDWATLVKAVEDRVIGALMLLLAAPIMLAIAIAIKFDSKGPVFFRQRRYGFNNELIEVFKFRSLHVDQADANASKLVVKGDTRVTRVGRIIRKTGLDELPQIFNVLRGDMSIVGPRPHATQAKAAGELYQAAVDGYYARHRMKPGITGWAQVNGWRGETDTVEKIQQRVAFDLEYIDNWSLAFDVAIIAMTPLVLLKMSEAH